MWACLRPLRLPNALKNRTVSKFTSTRRTPKLGQNFLADPAAARAIAESLGPVEDRTVLEIGPGEGAITELLAGRAKHLIAVELDRQLAPSLRQRFAALTNVQIVEADILNVDFATLLPSAKASAVGNLPYYITTDILRHLLAAHQHFDTIVIMVQREVAERIAATPGHSEYGSLSAMVQLYASVENLFTLPPEAFSPPPKVHSSVLRLTIAPRFAELEVQPEPFLKFIRSAFAQKRKTLRNNLKEHHQPEVLRAALDSAGLRADIRAEALTLEQMAALWRGVTTIE